jgi:hypothetical protein
VNASHALSQLSYAPGKPLPAFGERAERQASPRIMGCQAQTVLVASVTGVYFVSHGEETRAIATHRV